MDNIFYNMVKVAPELRNPISMMSQAMSGDMIWTVSPATATKAPTSSAWTRAVRVKLTNAAGDVHSWCSATITSGVSIADTSTAGTATIASTTLDLKNGEAVITVSGDAASWADTETNTLTVASATIMGYTVAAKTSVETITA